MEKACLMIGLYMTYIKKWSIKNSCPTPPPTYIHIYIYTYTYIYIYIYVYIHTMTIGKKPTYEVVKRDDPRI